MFSKLSQPAAKRLNVCVIGLSLLLLSSLLSHFLLFNISPSMPRGIYRIVQTQKFKRNDIVAGCLKGASLQLGRDRNYLLAGNQCINSQPVIKKILAAPGDVVILEKNQIVVNDKAYPYKTFAQDRQGRPLPAIKRGQYLNGFWLIGTHNPRSWDARYWGAIPKTQLLYTLKPLLIES